MYEGTMYDVRFLFKTKDEINRPDEEETGYSMIPPQRHMESDCRENDKHQQGDYLLNHLQLHQTEGSAVSFKTHPVSRYLQAVLKERDAPGHQNNQDKRCRIADHM